MRLSIRGQKLVLSSATGMCVFMAGTLIAWGTRPVSPIDDRGVAKSSNDSAAKPLVQPPAGPTKEDFAQLCDLPLRRPLYDPPPPAPEVRQLPPLGIELLGTIIEGENSIAMVRSEQGKVEYRRVGESVGPADSPAKIVGIHGNEVLLDRAAKRITLQVLSNERR